MTTPILLPNLDAPERSPSRHELARFVAGELSPERRAEIESLLANDDHVRKTLDELKAEDAAFRVEIPLERFLSDHEKKTQPPLAAFMSRFRFPALGVLVASAAAVFFLVRQDEPGTREKGGARVAFFVKDGDAAHPGKEGERLAAGDRIQFAVRDDANKSAMVLVGVDGRGEVTIYAAEPVDRIKGEEKFRPLPVSLVLDDATGAERFFVVYGDGEVAALKARVEAAAKRIAGADLVKSERLPLGNDDVQSSIHIMKVAR